MRLLSGSLPVRARLQAPRIPSPFRQNVCGVHNYARTAAMLRMNSALTTGSRPTLSQSTTFSDSEQRRGITQQYAKRMKDAKDEWAHFAKQIKEGKRKSFSQHLEDRELLHDVVGERELLDRVFTEKRVGLYAGVDPTGPSLHVGHMLPFMVLAWGYVWGLPVHFILGGSTSRIGDPSGRLTGRARVESSVRKANMAAMHMQLKKLGKGIERYGAKHGYIRQWAWRRSLTNNSVWWSQVTFQEVMRDLGAFMRLGPMLGRDTVKTRLEGDGMSFAEFSYPLMQAWDWWELFQKGVQVQVGGADQYGNILFGMDAVKSISRSTADEQSRKDLKKDIDQPIGLTTPLLTTSSGEKFGKSAGNAIWLDKDMTSTFELYQFFVRTPDDVVKKYLKMFTFLPLPKIDQIMDEHVIDPSKRVAQHALAAEFVELIHGKTEAEAVALQHRQLFRSRSSTGEPTPLPGKPKPHPIPQSPYASDANMAAGNIYAPQTNWEKMPSLRMELPRSVVYGQSLSKVLWSAGLVNSKSEAHRLCANGGAYVGSRPSNSGQIEDQLEFTPIGIWLPDMTERFIMDGELLFLKVGKWKFKIVKIISDEEFAKKGLTCPGFEPEPKAADQSN
ncbi:tyrosine--tRNA ligase MSY1 [Aspergillus homomorphus CBS 101889]|uniref:Tyrosine--tRNA ligase n=1 Tax=Aspergillus homomorphus (strain CBS 101889) TaxID=1450537 RepID=A0A395I780_ASPHC|nr:tyrosyl-tRNA synthetase mitochondrial precursor [Aspergillus homomorphus CBS 101889]RAL15957.1 tyrosyl-tRNA synthetase mitochondrial precursor [Aspergillus homomorphus CBS 101889]